MTLAIGDRIPGFSLPATDGRTYTVESFKETRLLVVLFTCNHCPYVQAYEDRIIQLHNTFAGNVAFVCINANDEQNYPDDRFEKMIERAKEKGFPFPYLRDKDQTVAQAFGAERTPEAFVFDTDRRLAYHGGIDDNCKEPEKVTAHYLHDAIHAVLEGTPVKDPQMPTIGCTIKWFA